MGIVHYLTQLYSPLASHVCWVKRLQNQTIDYIGFANFHTTYELLFNLV